jgi:hypothetical protein
LRKIHELRAKGATLLFVSHETSDVKAMCDRCLWLQKGVVQELGEADEVAAKYMTATMHREAVTDAATVTRDAHAAVTPGAMTVRFRNEPAGYRFGDGMVTILGADLVDPAGEPRERICWGDHVIVRVSFRADAPVAEPIAGFLLRNTRGENIFGSNTARENYPLPNMLPGDTQTLDFVWSVPSLKPDIYRLSLAVADGNLEDVRMCDYMEDALTVEIATDNRVAGPSAGYLQLRCYSVTVHRS